MNRNEYILLDVLYEDTHYKKVNSLSLENPFVKWEGEPVKVNVPSADDILGDKLTAFAPNTSGIPYIKNGLNRNLEIIKQLYDVGRLFDAATDLDCIKTAYGRIVPVEMSYRNLPPIPFCRWMILSQQPSVLQQEANPALVTLKHSRTELIG